MKSFKDKNHEIAYNMMQIRIELVDVVYDKDDGLA